MHKKAHLVIALALTSALALTGCTSSPKPTSTPSDIPTSAAPTDSSSAGAGYTSRITVSSDLSAKPEISLPEDSGNVDNLMVADVVEGTGAAVQSTDNVTVNYVGIGAVSRQQFDSSWDAGQTASFPLNGVILGWQQGLVGMKVGGRRLLVIPGPLAYGTNAPAGSGIGSNETLIFVVDLVSIP